MQLGVRAKILAGDGVCTDQLADLAGAAAANVVCSEAGASLDKMPGGVTFKSKYAKRFNQPIQLYALYSYDAIYIIVDAMKRANSTDPAKILAAMPKTNYAGVLGSVTFESSTRARLTQLIVDICRQGFCLSTSKSGIYIHRCRPEIGTRCKTSN